MNTIKSRRASAGVAALGAAALTFTGVASVSAQTLSISSPLHLPIALTSDTYLAGNPIADFLESFGVGDMVRSIFDPETAAYPLVIAVDALFQVGVLLPLTYMFGIPLTLLTEGPAGIGTLIDSITPLPAALMDAASNMGQWYATHNPFTGELLGGGGSFSLDSLLSQLGLGWLSGGEGFNLFDMSTWGDALGLDSLLSQLGLDWLTGGEGFNLFDMSTWGDAFGLDSLMGQLGLDWLAGGEGFNLFDMSTWGDALGLDALFSGFDFGDFFAAA